MIEKGDLQTVDLEAEERKRARDEEMQRRFELKQSGKIAEYKGLEYRLLDDGKFSIYADEAFKNKYRNTYELMYPAPGQYSLECFEIPNEINGIPVTTINSIAFQSQNTRALKSVIIPESVTNIDPDCFGDLINARLNVTIDSNNPEYKIIDGCLYTKDGKTLLKAVCTKTTFAIPEGVNTIARNALYGNRNLSELIIPTSVKRMESDVAFDINCKTIFYKGTKDDWKSVDVTTNEYALKKEVTVYYYGEKKKLFGKYWHYAADGVTPEIL